MEPTVRLLGTPAVELGDERLEPAPNKVHALLAREIFRRRGHRGTLAAETEQHLARIALRDVGRDERARDHLRAALEIALRTDTPRVLLDTAVATAELLSAEGRAVLASELVVAARDDPATEIRTRQEIERLKERGVEDHVPVQARDRDWIASTLAEILGTSRPA